MNTVKLIVISPSGALETVHGNMCRTCQDTHVYCRKRNPGNDLNSDRVSKSANQSRRRPRPRSGGAFAAITLSVALAGAVTAAGSSNPTPPPAATANERRQDRRWVGWSTTQPGPPPDTSFRNGGNGIIDHGTDTSTGSTSALNPNETGPWIGSAAGATGQEVSERRGFDVDGAGNYMETREVGEGQRMGGPPQGYQHYHQSGQQPPQQRTATSSQQAQHGMMGMNQHHGGRGQGAGPFMCGEDNEREVGNARREQTTGPLGDNHQPPPWGHQYVPSPPRAPGSGHTHDGHTSAQADDSRDPVLGVSYQNASPAVPQHSVPDSTMAGHGATGERGERLPVDRVWEPPPPLPGSRVGAVTPEVTLSQYRPSSSDRARFEDPMDGAGGDGLAGEGSIPRSLLTNTDKEMIFDGLKKLYRKKILPLEESSRFAHFHSPPLNPADFEAKPMVLIVGQYSVGKTSFIRSLLKKDFPGQRVGPEPTTDRFVAVTHGEDERVMPGHALAMQADKPFRSLQQFGNNFLTKFEGSVVDAPILRNITLVDTPGVLSGEKQRIGRDYDFASVISWFAERADLIVVMFDAHKLDISDELKMVIDTLKPHHDKMRVLLNKADTIDTQQLMRVYGALMWSLGKVMNTPEVCRVYIGSFWEAPLSNPENRFLLEKEKYDLLNELMLLPENAVVRRINELVKRARSVKVHAYIIHYLRKQMPYVMGKQDKQEKLINRLDQEFLACARRYNLPFGDFPKVEKYRRSLRAIKDISRFKALDKSLVHEMDKVFSNDIPKLMEQAAGRSWTNR